MGYGQSYPTHVHHRGASIASISVLQSAVGCVQGFDAWYHRPEGNPNVIYGALVGGPDKNDGFYDDRSNYEQTEPTLPACAPLIGLFSKLQSAYGAPGKNLGIWVQHNIKPMRTGGIFELRWNRTVCSSILSLLSMAPWCRFLSRSKTRDSFNIAWWVDILEKKFLYLLLNCVFWIITCFNFLIVLDYTNTSVYF